jgi:hypothetical protein
MGFTKAGQTEQNDALIVDVKVSAWQALQLLLAGAGCAFPASQGVGSL